MSACSRHRTLAAICALLLCASAPLIAASASTTKPSEKVEALPELSNEDLVGVKAMFDKLAQAFVVGDAAAVNNLFASDLRARVGDNLESEFQQSRYLMFEVLQVQPDDTLRENVHSVDVRVRYVMVERGWAPELQDSFAAYLKTSLADAQKTQGADAPINMDEILKGFIKANKLQERIPRLTEPHVNSTSQNFVIQKTKEGHFKIRDSFFFDNLGIRQGMGLVVEGLLAAMFVCALLAFWVWMGWEAMRARPRYTVWRWVVLIPFIGALAFFAAAYLPRQLRGQKTEA